MIDFACKRFQLIEVIKCALGLSKSDLKLMNFLLANDDDWFSSEELADKHSLNLTTAQRSLKKLNERGVIERRQENLKGGGYAYFYRIKYKKELRELVFSIVNGWTKKVKDELEKW